MYMFNWDNKDKNQTVKDVSELILNGGKELKQTLEKSRPIYEMP